METEKSMKVNEVTMVGALPPLKGNAYYCLSLSREMSQSIRTDFISFKNLYPNFLYPGGVKDPDPDFHVSETAALRVRRVINYYNPLSWMHAGFLAQTDVVHLQWWSVPLAPVYLLLLIILKIRRKKIVLTVHNVVSHEKSVLDYLLNKSILHFGDAWIVHSVNNQETLAKYCSLPSRKIHVIPMPVHDMYQKNGVGRDQTRKKLKIPDCAKVILSFGNIRPYKGIDKLIEALPRIMRTVPDIHLLIAGQVWGSWEEPYGQLVDRLGLKNHVTVLPDYLPMSQVADVFQASDLVALPYLYFDAQSGVGNTALAFNLPLVVTRVGGLPDLVDDERAICEPGCDEALADVIARIFLDRRLYTKLRNDSHALSQKYSWRSACELTREVYQTVISDDRF